MAVLVLVLVLVLLVLVRAAAVSTVRPQSGLPASLGATFV